MSLQLFFVVFCCLSTFFLVVVASATELDVTGSTLFRLADQGTSDVPITLYGALERGTSPGPCLVEVENVLAKRLVVNISFNGTAAQNDDGCRLEIKSSTIGDGGIQIFGEFSNNTNVLVENVSVTALLNGALVVQPAELLSVGGNNSHHDEYDEDIVRVSTRHVVVRNSTLKSSWLAAGGSDHTPACGSTGYRFFTVCIELPRVVASRGGGNKEQQQHASSSSSSLLFEDVCDPLLRRGASSPSCSSGGGQKKSSILIDKTSLQYVGTIVDAAATAILAPPASAAEKLLLCASCVNISVTNSAVEKRIFGSFVKMPPSPELLQVEHFGIWFAGGGVSAIAVAGCRFDISTAATMNWDAAVAVTTMQTARVGANNSYLHSFVGHDNIFEISIERISVGKRANSSGFLFSGTGLFLPAVVTTNNKTSSSSSSPSSSSSELILTRNVFTATAPKLSLVSFFDSVFAQASPGNKDRLNPPICNMTTISTVRIDDNTVVATATLVATETEQSPTFGLAEHLPVCNATLVSLVGNNVTIFAKTLEVRIVQLGDVRGVRKIVAANNFFEVTPQGFDVWRCVAITTEYGVIIGGGGGGGGEENDDGDNSNAARLIVVENNTFISNGAKYLVDFFHWGIAEFVHLSSSAFVVHPLQILRVVNNSFTLTLTLGPHAQIFVWGSHLVSLAGGRFGNVTIDNNTWTCFSKENLKRVTRYSILFFGLSYQVSADGFMPNVISRLVNVTGNVTVRANHLEINNESSAVNIVASHDPFFAATLFVERNVVISHGRGAGSICKIAGVQLSISGALRSYPVGFHTFVGVLWIVGNKLTLLGRGNSLRLITTGRENYGLNSSLIFIDSNELTSLALAPSGRGFTSIFCNLEAVRFEGPVTISPGLAASTFPWLGAGSDGGGGGDNSVFGWLVATAAAQTGEASSSSASSSKMLLIISNNNVNATIPKEDLQPFGGYFFRTNTFFEIIDGCLTMSAGADAVVSGNTYYTGTEIPVVKNVLVSYTHSVFNFEQFDFGGSLTIARNDFTNQFSPDVGQFINLPRVIVGREVEQDRRTVGGVMKIENNTFLHIGDVSLSGVFLSEVYLTNNTFIIPAWSSDVQTTNTVFIGVRVFWINLHLPLTIAGNRVVARNSGHLVTLFQFVILERNLSLRTQSAGIVVRDNHVDIDLLSKKSTGLSFVSLLLVNFSSSSSSFPFLRVERNTVTVGTAKKFVALVRFGGLPSGFSSSLAGTKQGMVVLAENRGVTLQGNVLIIVNRSTSSSSLSPLTASLLSVSPGGCFALPAKKQQGEDGEEPTPFFSAVNNTILHQQHQPQNAGSGDAGAEQQQQPLEAALFDGRLLMLGDGVTPFSGQVLPICGEQQTPSLSSQQAQWIFENNTIDIVDRTSSAANASLLSVRSSVSVGPASISFAGNLLRPSAAGFLLEQQRPPGGGANFLFYYSSGSATRYTPRDGLTVSLGGRGGGGGGCNIIELPTTPSPRQRPIIARFVQSKLVYATVLAGPMCESATLSESLSAASRSNSSVETPSRTPPSSTLSSEATPSVSQTVHIIITPTATPSATGPTQSRGSRTTAEAMSLRRSASFPSESNSASQTLSAASGSVSPLPSRTAGTATGTRSLDLPLPKAPPSPMAVAAEATRGAVTATSVLSGSPVAALPLQRSVALAHITTVCRDDEARRQQEEERRATAHLRQPAKRDDDDTEPLDVISSPSRLSIGSGSLRYYKGAAAGNVLVCAGWCTFLFVLMFCFKGAQHLRQRCCDCADDNDDSEQQRQQQQQKAAAVNEQQQSQQNTTAAASSSSSSSSSSSFISTTLRVWAFPSRWLVPFLFLTSGTVQALAAVFARQEQDDDDDGGNGLSSNDVALVISACVLITVPAIIGVKNTIVGSKDERHCLRETGQKFPPRWRLIMKAIFEGKNQWTTTSDFSQKYSILLDPCSNPKVLLLDIATTIACSVCSGVAATLPPERNACLPLVCCVLALLAIHTVVLFAALWRPFFAPFDNYAYALLSVLGTAYGVVGVLIVLGHVHADVGAAVGMAQGICAILFAATDFLGFGLEAYDAYAHRALVRAMNAKPTARVYKRGRLSMIGAVDVSQTTNNNESEETMQFLDTSLLLPQGKNISSQQQMMMQKNDDDDDDQEMDELVLQERKKREAASSSSPKRMKQNDVTTALATTTATRTDGDDDDNDQQRQEIILSPASSSTSRLRRNSSRSSSSSGNVNKPKKKVWRCTLCGEPGHFMRQCPQH